MKGGGAGKAIPMYKYGKNDPGMPQEQKEITTQRIMANQHESHKKTSAPQPLIDLQVYSPPPPPKPAKKTDTVNFIPIGNTSISGYPANINGLGNVMPIMHQVDYVRPQIVKTYNIQSVNPNDDHSRLNLIFEDVIPSHLKGNGNFILEQRMGLINYLRGNMIEDHDGEEIDITGQFKDKHRSLASYIKYLEMNPLDIGKRTNNPYKNLPDGMLIYRACYPIELTNMSSTKCSDDSIGLMVRIYKMTKAEMNIDSIPGLERKQFSTWRDIMYYEIVREEILKKKVSPNFVGLMAYFLCKNSGIDWMSIEKAKSGKTINSSGDRFASQQQIRKYLYGVPYGSNPPFVPDGNPEINLTDINANTGESLVALTEAPTHNIFSWASKTYANDGISRVHKMVSSGYHSENIWMSVLFQLFQGMLTMQYKGFSFKDFSLENNIFIKDLRVNHSVTDCWKYSIEGIDYYVPNHGYLVMIDSSFNKKEGKDANLLYKSKELDEMKVATPSMISSDIERMKSYASSKAEDEFHIQSKFFTEVSNDVIRRQVFESFIRVTDIGNFTSSDFKANGGVLPPDEIRDLLNRINIESRKALSENNIGKMDILYYIQEYFKIFMHNRIGTYIRESEQHNLRIEGDQNFQWGEIVAFASQYQGYTFAIFVKKSGSHMATIFTKDKENGPIVRKDVSIGSIVKYYDQNLEQDSKGEPQQILETYILSDE